MFIPIRACGKRCTTAKQPDVTRQAIMEAALTRFHEGGFSATSLDQLLEGTGVTKGALYYHFPNKQALGYAIVDEMIRGWIHERWVRPLAHAENVIEELKIIVRRVIEETPENFLAFGCPLNNLTQELAAVDEGFRTRLASVYQDWHEGLAASLHKGQAAGQVRTDIDVAATAALVVASFEGIAGAMKAAPNKDFALRLVGAFGQLIDGLRPAGVTQEAVSVD
jgi:TetR/AcrR family transcriptional regulator, transcriptional repressor for nem operon